MRQFTIVVISIISFYQVRASCVEDLTKLFTHDVANTELQLNITAVGIYEKINTTRQAIETLIKNTKYGIQIEREALEDEETAAYGKSLVKKKSIADCLEQDRIQMRMINATESVIYSVCRADLSLFLVELSIGSLNGLSRQLQRNLEGCINDDISYCEDEKACIMKTLEQTNDDINRLNARVENRLDKIVHTSQICADGKKDVVVSIIKEQEKKFDYCVEQILN